MLSREERWLCERYTETLMMQPIPGGVVARPLIAHHNTLDIGFYRRIAPERLRHAGWLTMACFHQALWGLLPWLEQSLWPEQWP